MNACLPWPNRPIPRVTARPLIFTYDLRLIASRSTRLGASDDKVVGVEALTYEVPIKTSTSATGVDEHDSRGFCLPLFAVIYGQ